MGAGDLIATNGSGPMNRILDHTDHVGMIEDWECFVTGLEVEDASVTTLPAAAGAENLTATIVADEDQFVRLRDTEGLTVGLNMVQMNEAVNSLGDGMCRITDPDKLSVTVFPPCKTAGRTHQQLEGLAMVR